MFMGAIGLLGKFGYRIIGLFSFCATVLGLLGLLMNRSLMFIVYGSWVMAQGSWLGLHDEERDARLPGLGCRAPLFSCLRALSHEP